MSEHEIVDVDKDGEQYIQRDSLIKVDCKHGEIISVENYRVLGFLQKIRTSCLFQLRRGFSGKLILLSKRMLRSWQD